MNTSQSISPMNDQHRATDLEWYCIKSRVCDAHSSGVAAYSTIHELLCRIEALEAKDEDNKEAWAAMRKAGISADLRVKALQRRIDALEASATAQPNHPEIPGGSLVKRVEDAIYRSCTASRGFREEARAAIREVAAWLREHYGGLTATSDLLEQEAKR